MRSERELAEAFGTGRGPVRELQEHMEEAAERLRRALAAHADGQTSPSRRP
jgi:hypothetical protein